MESSASSTTEHTTYSYNPKALLDLPYRIFSPPHAGAPCVGRVRRLSLTPIYEVQLEDVLAGKHLPPLGLPEFESYLMHVERSHENLYFMLWFRAYEKQYQFWSHSPTYPQQSPTLAHFYSRAKQTFLVPSAPLELNISSSTRKVFLTANHSPHPPPSALAEIKTQVESMLKESLKTFIRSNGGNAGRKRGLFAICVGLTVMCVGLAPILLSALDGRSRWLRFAALPCFWFGATTLIGGLHGICIVIFLFGDARQLTEYELAFPKMSPYTSSCKKIPHISSNRIPPAEHIEISPKPTKASDPSQHPYPSETSHAKSLPKMQVSPAHAASEKYLPRSWQDTSRPPSPSSPVTPYHLTPPSSMFDFNHLPFTPSPEKKFSGSTPTWAPLTKVIDAISIRTQWETMMRSAALAFLVALVLVGISIAAE